MRVHHLMMAAAAMCLLAAARPSAASIKTVIDRNAGDQATSAFKFEHVPAPSKTDAATNAQFTIVDGERDENGGELDVLHDGKVPSEEDEPAANFFFSQRSDGGRIEIDLGKVIEVKQVNTYSWHPNTRGPQVYKLYGVDGKSADFKDKPKNGVDPTTCGWKLLADVDTRPKDGEGGGQYGVSILDTDGPLGSFRYLLLETHQTESNDPFGNTFYSEIDVVGPKDIVAGTPAAPTEGLLKLQADGGKYDITIDTTDTPDLTQWAKNELAPVVVQWYPKIVQMLPSDGFEAPKKFSITFRKDMRGVAATGGTRIMGADSWFKNNLEGEAKGAIVHEMVHVVQQYGRARRNNPNATRAPGWLVEGIPDYIRWFLYEPQSHGAQIRPQVAPRVRYDASYRVSANFLNWVTSKYDKDIVPQLNDVLRKGEYSEDLWKNKTGKTVQELGDEWKKDLAAGAAAPAAPAPAAAPALAASQDESTNTLTDQEKQEGWKLLFDGKSLDGWHSFRRNNVLPGWQVRDGTLACVDPSNAGDLCTNDKYKWFELQLDYNISEGGNSGILYHVTDAGHATWETGPEFQLLDNKEGHDGPDKAKRQLSGWLYALYAPPIDPATGHPLDATKPAGQWNHIRLLISPDKCEHDMNGVKYFDYVLGSDEFKSRVAHSKFNSMKNFAKFDTGYIALQGDHGQVTFRNIKIKPLPDQ